MVKQKDYSEYENSLSKSFPSELKSQLTEVFHSIPFDENKTTNFYNQQHTVSGLISKNGFKIILNDEKCQIPYRVYFNAPKKNKERKLNQTQKDILNCIYTRHHNGRIRQQSLNNLSKSNSYWITPFRIQLLGEYVYEIYETLSEQLSDEILDNCKRFLEENPEFANKTKDKLISYYGIYYKWKHPKFRNYLGREILDRINQKFIGLNQEEITQIGVDKEDRFFVKPKNKDFSMIYRLAKGIDWNSKVKVLQSSTIREWKKYKWYLHILFTIYNECGIELMPTKQTEYINLDRKTINQIRQNKKRPHNKR